jgi:site-specific DNA-methyltransferase (adenine-specific)
VRVHDGREAGKPGGSNPRNRTNDAKLNHHPTVNPTDLMRYLVRLVTPTGGTVLDPFMGSGTTAVSCKKLNRIYMGSEMDSNFCNIAEQRILTNDEYIKNEL